MPTRDIQIPDLLKCLFCSTFKTIALPLNYTYSSFLNLRLRD